MIQLLLSIIKVGDNVYNLKDVLTEKQKKILKKNKISYDKVINSNEDMKKFVSYVFDNVEGYKNIQDIADTIVQYHNRLKLWEPVNFQ